MGHEIKYPVAHQDHRNNERGTLVSYNAVREKPRGPSPDEDQE